MVDSQTDRRVPIVSTEFEKFDRDFAIAWPYTSRRAFFFLPTRRKTLQRSHFLIFSPETPTRRRRTSKKSRRNNTIDIVITIHVVLNCTRHSRAFSRRQSAHSIPWYIISMLYCSKFFFLFFFNDVFSRGRRKTHSYYPSVCTRNTSVHAHEERVKHVQLRVRVLTIKHYGFNRRVINTVDYSDGVSLRSFKFERQNKKKKQKTQRNVIAGIMAWAMS